jgi:hypothetical protein
VRRGLAVVTPNSQTKTVFAKLIRGRAMATITLDR